MSGQDYEKIAFVLNQAIAYREHAVSTVLDIADELCAILKQDNPNFDPKEFIDKVEEGLL